MKKTIATIAIAIAAVACQNQQIDTEADVLNNNTTTNANISSSVASTFMQDGYTFLPGEGGPDCSGGGGACEIVIANSPVYPTAAQAIAATSKDANTTAIKADFNGKDQLTFTTLQLSKAQAAYMANADVLKALTASLGTAANSTTAASVGGMKFAYGSTSLSQALRLGLLQNLYSNYADVKETLARTGNPLYQSRTLLTDALGVYQAVSVVKPAKAAVEIAFGEALAKSPASNFPASAYNCVSVVRPAKVANSGGGEVSAYNMTSLVRPAKAANGGGTEVSVYNYVSVVRPAMVLQGLGNEMIAAGATAAGKKLVETAQARWDGYVVKFLTADNFDTETELLGSLTANEYQLLAKAGVLQKFRKLWYSNVPAAMGLTANRSDFTHLTVAKDMALPAAVAKALGVGSLTLKAGSYAYTSPTTVNMAVVANSKTQ